MLEPWRRRRTLAAEGVRKVALPLMVVVVLEQSRGIPAADAADGNVAGPLRVPVAPEEQQRPVVAVGDPGQ